MITTSHHDYGQKSEFSVVTTCFWSVKYFKITYCKYKQVTYNKKANNSFLSMPSGRYFSVQKKSICMNHTESKSLVCNKLMKKDLRFGFFRVQFWLVQNFYTVLSFPWFLHKWNWATKQWYWAVKWQGRKKLFYLGKTYLITSWLNIIALPPNFV